MSYRDTLKKERDGRFKYFLDSRYRTVAQPSKADRERMLAEAVRATAELPVLSPDAGEGEV